MKKEGKQGGVRVREGRKERGEKCMKSWFVDKYGYVNAYNDYAKFTRGRGDSIHLLRKDYVLGAELC